MVSTRPGGSFRSSVLFIPFLISVQISIAAAAAGDWTTHTFANDVRSLAFDGDAVWMATVGGAVRFDRSADLFTVFTNTVGLGDNDVTGVGVDDNRDVWLGTAGNGLSRRRQDTGEWRTFTRLDGLASERVSVVLIESSRLWVGTDDGISLFIWGQDPDERRDTFIFSDAFRASRGVPLADLNALAIGSDTIWAGTETGISTVLLSTANLKDPANWTTYSPADGLPDLRVTTLAVSGTEVWAGTRDGMARFDGTGWVPQNTGLLSREIRDATFIDGTLWVATMSEVARLEGGAWVSIGGSVGPGGARAVAGDTSGTVWIGSAQNGLARLEQGLWEFFPTKGPYANNVKAAFIDRDDNLWFGFNEGGVSRFDGTAWRSYDSSHGLPSGAITMIGEHNDGRKWFGSFGNGLARFDDRGTVDVLDDRWETFDQTNSPFEGVREDPNFVPVTAWSRDAEGGQWFGNFGVGAQFLDSSGVFTTFREGSSSLSSARIRGITVGSDNSVWFATDNRLSRYQSGSGLWEVFGTTEGLLSPQVNALASSNKGDLWVGTDAGISQIEPGNLVTSYGLPGGLNTSRVTALDTDARGNVWVGSPSGLGKFDPGTFDWEVFTIDSSPLAASLINAITVNDGTGEIWIGTGHGISRFESGILPVRPTQAQVPVYPNPFVPSKGSAAVVFAQLADGAKISILTADGVLVKQIPSSQITAQQALWDGRNSSGQPVAGGIYFFVVTAPDGSHFTGKFAVIR
ncbi:MAG: FlgD immunoglobulin-like domain containing protein [Gemmatimonadota bacterium]|nr:FlgD immunoglobulin-like domain containing protein [Gemmatimonadota bacterium]